jgi:hypothetical protein
MSKITLDTLVLSEGSHNSPEEGLCVMEAVAYFNNEPHSDHPVCACPVLTAFMIRLNDRMPQSERDRLKAFIPRLIGTRDGLSAKRLEILVHSAVAEVTPHALRLTGIPALLVEADKCAAVPLGDCSAAESAAKSAAQSAAQSAAWSAARSAAWAAARSARSAEAAAWAAAESAEAAARAAAESARSAAWDIAIAALERALNVKE